MTEGLCLEACGVCTGYGAIQVLWDVDLLVPEGSAVVLLGPNGAGKSTLLRCIMGLVPLWRGELRYQGRQIDRWPPDRRVGASISYVSEVGVFSGLSVEDNLRACGTGLPYGEVRAALRRTWDAFPLLAERRRSAAGSLSGGQRKLLGLAKGLFRRPHLLILDEPSAGLAPVLVNEMMTSLAAVRDSQEVTLLLAEQNAKALDLADRVAVLNGGRKGFDDSAEEFRVQADITAEFFGLPSARVPSSRGGRSGGTAGDEPKDLA